MIDRFEKSKNEIDWLKKIKKSIIGLKKKSIKWSQKIDQAIDQTIKERKMENHTLFFYLVLLKIEKN